MEKSWPFEKNCDVDGVLISHVTRTKLEEADDGFLSLAALASHKRGTHVE